MFALPARLQLLDDRLAVRSNRLSRHRGLRDLLRVASRLGDGVAWYTLAACLFALFGGEALPALRHMLGQHAAEGAVAPGGREAAEVHAVGMRVLALRHGGLPAARAGLQDEG